MSKNESGLFVDQAGVEGGFADRAAEKMSGSHDVIQHEDDLSPAVKARLTEVVRDLRGAWLDGPALHWEHIHAIDPMTHTGLDKRVTASLRDGFLCFSQFLAGLEQLLLDCEQLGADRCERFLRLEKLVVHFADLGLQNGFVSDGKDALADVVGASDSANRCGDR